MEKIYKIALILLFFGLSPVTAKAANLYVSPAASNYGVGENFNAAILVNASQSINAVSSVLNFPTEYLGVVSLSTANSVIDAWVQEPSFSNADTTGNIRFEGVILNPGFTGSGGKIVDAVFRVKKIGLAALTFSESAILANDGLGTNVAVLPSSALYALIKSKTPTQEKTNADLDKRIEAVENKIKTVEANPPKSVIVIQKTPPPNGILGFWEVLPEWVKKSTLLLIGVTAFILLFIVITLGIVILIWFWGIFRQKVNKFSKKIFAYPGVFGKEINGDITYSSHKLKKEFQYIKKNHSLKLLLKNYWITFHQIIKRFFTINNK